MNNVERRKANNNLPNTANWLQWVSASLVILVAIAVVILAVANVKTVYEPHYLVQIFNTIFSFGAGLLIAIVAMQIYLTMASWWAFFLGSGALVFGISALLAGWVFPDSLNTSVTLFSIGTLISGGLHFFGAVQSPKSKQPSTSTNKSGSLVAVILLCLSIVIVFLLLSILPSARFFPKFYISGTGYTFTRYAITIAAAILFFASILFYGISHFRPRTNFIFWYCLGLAMVTIGILSAAFSSHGTPLNWLGRISQYLGSIYFLVSVLIALHESHVRGKSLAETILEYNKQSKLNYELLVNAANDAIIAVDDLDRVLAWNPASEDIFGYKADEIIGLSFFDLLLDPPEVETYKKATEALDLEKKPRASRAIDLMAKRQNGEHFPIALTLLLKKSPQGWARFGTATNTPTTLIVRDITERKKTEETILASRAKLETALASMSEAIFIADEKGRFVNFNDEFVRYHRFKNREACSKEIAECPNYIDAYFGDGSPAPVEMWAMSRALRGETGSNVEYMLRRKDTGETWWGNYNFGPIKDREGKITGAVVTTSEITQRKKAEEELAQSMQRNNAHMDNSPLAVIEFDPQFRVIRWSKEAERVFGWSSSEILGRAITRMKWVYDEDIDLVNKLSEDYTNAKNSTEHHTNRNYRKDGSVIWCEWYNSSIYDSHGKLVSVLSQVLDITERKMAEEHLKQYTADLEVSNKELEAFAYSVSHDLRAPLRTLDGFSQAVVDDYGDKLDDTGKDYLRRVRDAAKHMDQITKDMLTLSRVIRSELRIGDVNLSNIVSSLTKDLIEKEPTRKVNFIIAPDVMVKGDASLLQMALYNLLENAWKFTAKTKEARIEFGTMVKDDERIYFVSDNGVGFDMQYVDKLFQPFQRLHTNAEYPGTGIGLATVQRVIRRHSGRIWAESQVGKGTTFYFTLG
jgi:PAS domain S-box-containing protein